MILTQQTEEWLSLRRKKIGASDAPIIMGASPWATPFQLWQDKVGLKKGKATTFSMRRGIDMEAQARECFERMTGIIMLPEVVFHSSIDYMMASLDGIDLDHENIVEIKCPNKNDHAVALSGKVPPKYIPQLQHQMEVCELDEAYYFSFDGEKGALVKLQRDDSYIKELLDKEYEFYQFMQNFIPPPMTEKDHLKLEEDKRWKEAFSF